MEQYPSEQRHTPAAAEDQLLGEDRLQVGGMRLKEPIPKTRPKTRPKLVFIDFGTISKNEPSTKMDFSLNKKL